MARAHRRQGKDLGAEAEGSTSTDSRDTMYKILANRRRRYTIQHLKSQDDEVTLGALAEQVGAWEYGTDPGQLTSAERKTVYTALQQRHLPKMADVGIVEFDKRAGTVAPTESLTDLDIYAEVVSSGDFPWSQYYFGLSVIAVALMAAVWMDVYPLVSLPDLAWGIFVTISFAVSALVHVAVTREMKLGTASKPPDIREDERS